MPCLSLLACLQHKSQHLSARFALTDWHRVSAGAEEVAQARAEAAECRARAEQAEELAQQQVTAARCAQLSLLAVGTLLGHLGMLLSRA